MPHFLDADGPKGQDLEPVSLSKLDKLAACTRSKLKSGGPQVDNYLLLDYASGELTTELRDLVRQRIRSWASWHDAYWQTRAYLELCDLPTEQ